MRTHADILKSSIYGKCIFADYNNVYKDKCATEFMKLKECYLVRLAISEYHLKRRLTLLTVHRKRISNGNTILHV